jgi:hypothetical protein
MRMLLLKIAGVIQVMLALVHFVFPRYFKWKVDLGAITLVNKQLMYVHKFFIALVVLLMGVVCLAAPQDILSTRLGKFLSLGLFVFWGTRLYFQFFVYSSILWKGKTFETMIHVMFSIIWVYLSSVFLVIYNLPR